MAIPSPRPAEDPATPDEHAGSVLPSTWLEELASLPIPLIADEVYNGLTYEG